MIKDTMNQQSYLYSSEAFNKALDQFQAAVESGDERSIRMAREAVKEQAPLQAIEYDFEVRRGLSHYFYQWQRGEVTEAQFKNNFCAAINSGIPGEHEANFEYGFPHLNFTPTRHGGLRYAVFNTERLWLVHQGMRTLKLEEKLC